ncbi:uncharacterized protein BO66DRAFT_438720 [Aspergillus aculeatinus CBS 121060]|uniref:Uncharacterized protein n=1 Tax=Aspergillus aculeatinus CBS 121060 TaxID=1448322 RepID=A0ACD1H8U7_9EURO|nr:hypothetical protein BO66DRAFT_438720 [Aspergillus aculeatinus CBS 121060]RAH70016.1 hypothetical protein BO66DRAFT_438720 [Aspergillus aculeatinus CBS 121060]
MVQLKPYKGDYYLWEYVPNLGAAVVFLLIFAVLTAMHTYRLIKTRTWFFELYGYGGRISAYRNTASLFSYALANDGLLLTPALFAASVYMTLGRVIRALHAQKFSLLPLTWLTRAVTGHTAGAKAVVLLGLFIQLLSFGIFGATAVVFYRRILAGPTPQCFNPLLPRREILYEEGGRKAGLDDGFERCGGSLVVLGEGIEDDVETSSWVDEAENGLMLESVVLEISEIVMAEGTMTGGG